LEVDDSTVLQVLFFSDMTIFYLVPLLLSSILYSLIAHVLLRSRNRPHFLFWPIARPHLDAMTTGRMNTTIDRQ
jgi:hypothetical protein